MYEKFGELLKGLKKHTNLGHSKRDEAFIRQVENLCLHPGGTGSGTSKKMTATASAYRFASNEAVDLAALREARLSSALDLCPDDETLLIINDVSLLDYHRHDSKEDRRAIGDGKGKGYEYVCNLGVTLESERCIGVLHDCLIKQNGPDDTEQVDYHANPQFNEISEKDPCRLECNHKHILNCHFNHIAAHVGKRRIVEVADREFDDHFIFEGCISKEKDLVIRSNAQRNVQVSAGIKWLPKEKHTKKYPGRPLLPDHICTSMKALVEHVPVDPYKAIPLDGKGRLTDEKSAKSHINVSAGTFTVTLYRKIKRNKTYIHPKEYLTLNVVVVKETDPPKDRKPLLWTLFTTLPTGTLDEIHKVVRIYELRWLIECFFKYLKSGFKLEDLRYDSARKTAIHIVSITIAVSFLINLRKTVGLPSSGTLSPEDYAKVKQAVKNPNDSNINPELRLFALIASQGGWRGRRSDPISPMTLIKGFERVTATLEMLQNASELLQLFGEVLKE